MELTFYSEEGDKKFEDAGNLYDISAGGALFSHRKQVSKQKVLYFSTELPNGSSIKLQAVEVRNLRKNSKSETAPFVTGVKWKNLDSEAEQGITGFITQRSKERRENSRRSKERRENSR